MTDALDRLRGLDRALKIPLRRADPAGSPRRDVGVTDEGQVSLLIDLGFNGSIAIPEALFKATGNRLGDDAPIEQGDTSSTVFGERASTVRLGGLVLRARPVVTGTAVSDFHVGIAFLRHFRGNLDLQNNAIYLERRTPVEDPCDDFATYGFSPLLRGDALVVGALWRHCSAERVDLALGDRIVAIDGRATATTGFEINCRFLTRSASIGRGRSRLPSRCAATGGSERSRSRGDPCCRVLRRTAVAKTADSTKLLTSVNRLDVAR